MVLDCVVSPFNYSTTMYPLGWTACAFSAVAAIRLHHGLIFFVCIVTSGHRRAVSSSDQPHASTAATDMALSASAPLRPRRFVLLCCAMLCVLCIVYICIYIMCVCVHATANFALCCQAARRFVQGLAPAHCKPAVRLPTR